MSDVRHTLLEATRALERAGVPDPRLDAEWLLAYVLGMDRLAMRMSGAAQLTPQQEQRMASLLLSRTRRTPLQYLLGTQGFYGLELRTDARALIPGRKPKRCAKPASRTCAPSAPFPLPPRWTCARAAGPSPWRSGTNAPSRRYPPRTRAPKPFRWPAKTLGGWGFRWISSRGICLTPSGSGGST